MYSLTHGQSLERSHGHLKENCSRGVVSLSLFVIGVSTLLTILFRSNLFIFTFYLLTLPNGKKSKIFYC